MSPRMRDPGEAATPMAIAVGMTAGVEAQIRLVIPRTARLDTDPKCERGSTADPSLTLRVSIKPRRAEYKSGEMVTASGLDCLIRVRVR